MAWLPNKIWLKPTKMPLIEKQQRVERKWALEVRKKSTEAKNSVVQEKDSDDSTDADLNLPKTKKQKMQKISSIRKGDKIFVTRESTLRAGKTCHTRTKAPGNNKTSKY